MQLGRNIIFGRDSYAPFEINHKLFIHLRGAILSDKPNTHRCAVNHYDSPSSVLAAVLVHRPVGLNPSITVLSV